MLMSGSTRLDKKTAWKKTDNIVFFKEQDLCKFQRNSVLNIAIH